ERGAAIHKRRAGNIEGRGAIGKRGADHRQFGTGSQGRGTGAGARRPEQPVRRNPCGNAVSRHRLNIKRFTPAISSLLNLLSTDIGRPLRDMTFKFDDPTLIDDAGKVLDDLSPRRNEVKTADAHWYKRT